MKKVIVYMPGVWDLLHVGHVAILEKAKAMGDVLIVGVPTNEVVLEDKGSLPVITCSDRVCMLSALRCVDLAIPYDALEFLTALRRYDVDVLVTGTQWGNQKRHIDAIQYMERKGGRVVQFKYTDGVSSTTIRKKIAKGT